MTVARDPTTNLPLSARIAELEAALAAERERREAAACPPPGSNIITLRWTDNGRAWIESERNRELARRLRYYPTANFDEAAIRESADALDGGEL